MGGRNGESMTRDGLTGWSHSMSESAFGMNATTCGNAGKQPAPKQAAMLQPWASQEALGAFSGVARAVSGFMWSHGSRCPMLEPAVTANVWEMACAWAAIPGATNPTASSRCSAIRRKCRGDMRRF